MIELLLVILTFCVLTFFSFIPIIFLIIILAGLAVGIFVSSKGLVYIYKKYKP